LLGRYVVLQNVGIEVVHKYVLEGLGQVIKKSNVLISEEGQLVLVSKKASVSHPCGLDNMMGYFLH
jgi:hypothetical protein